MAFSKKSLVTLNKLLNIVILILVLIVFYLMITLLRKEYFYSRGGYSSVSGTGSFYSYVRRNKENKESNTH